MTSSYHQARAIKYSGWHATKCQVGKERIEWNLRCRCGGQAVQGFNRSLAGCACAENLNGGALLQLVVDVVFLRRVSTLSNDSSPVFNFNPTFVNEIMCPAFRTNVPRKKYTNIHKQDAATSFLVHRPSWV